MPNHWGIREGLVPWLLEVVGGRLQWGRGKGSHLILGRARSWGGGSVGLDFPGHKISKQLKSINMFIFRLARG